MVGRTLIIFGPVCRANLTSHLIRARWYLSLSHSFRVPSMETVIQLVQECLLTGRNGPVRLRRLFAPFAALRLVVACDHKMDG